jgi:hypothetical protein
MSKLLLNNKNYAKWMAEYIEIDGDYIRGYNTNAEMFVEERISHIKHFFKKFKLNFK